MTELDTTLAPESRAHVPNPFAAFPLGELVALVQQHMESPEAHGILTPPGIVDAIAALERLKNTAAGLQARLTEDLRSWREAAAGELTAGRVVQSVGSEIGLARHESPWLADQHVALARLLPREMSHTWQLLQQGRITEPVAVGMLAKTAMLSREHRAEVDAAMADMLPSLSTKQALAEAARLAAQLDPAAVVARRAAAVSARRVTVRPAPDGMAYLTVLGPMIECVGAYASLRRHAEKVNAGVCESESPDGRPTAQIAADTALRLCSGRAAGEPQPVEVHLVMTDRSLLGVGDPDQSIDEPARILGHGWLPADEARELVRDESATVFLRRLYVAPRTEHLVAMDSRRRRFSGLLRRMLVIRDDRCRTPWCDAPIGQADHSAPVRSGGETTYGNGAGLCTRCNQVKEAPGWLARNGPPGRTLLTPTRQEHTAEEMPVLGWARRAGQSRS